MLLTRVRRRKSEVLKSASYDAFVYCRELSAVFIEGLALTKGWKKTENICRQVGQAFQS